MIYEKQRQVSLIRLRRMRDKSLRIIEGDRNMCTFIFPWEEKAKDENGYSMVLQSFSKRLNKNELFRLAKRLEQDDINENHDWIKNWNYLYEITRMN